MPVKYLGKLKHSVYVCEKLVLCVCAEHFMSTKQEAYLDFNDIEQLDVSWCKRIGYPYLQLYIRSQT